ncbi:P-type conjugative transfer ATPase TrbB [Bradyrhizobium japonicum]|nr:P-type conjugative transfer ATPase TrbB [Bradyrhizobium japonicum]MCP1855462.1 P-type conjugative transfer ATPase TrbB [Bradyrhizobium japonicum]MCP1897747.1 P-type conjugative transfer ATPase TrbB [Bradyrhizobium japonicum]MCW2319697.1 P-type conjugative transfer ATPase TrbB [Bradyrhizobium japonicum]
MTQLRSHPRLIRKLQDALGKKLCVALDDATVVEIMLNPDGRLFIERLGHGMAATGEMTAAAAEIVIGSVAHALNCEADDEQPIISGELPIGGHRFEGLLPPIVKAPAFTIRRRASRLIPLDDYVKGRVMTERQADIIRNAVASRLNIVISGGTGSGKTTLANAVIAEIAETAPDDRILILEDTAEIQCPAENVVALHTSDTVDMARLLKSTMRLRPRPHRRRRGSRRRRAYAAQSLEHRPSRWRRHCPCEHRRVGPAPARAALRGSKSAADARGDRRSRRPHRLDRADRQGPRPARHPPRRGLRQRPLPDRILLSKGGNPCRLTALPPASCWGSRSAC